MDNEKMLNAKIAEVIDELKSNRLLREIPPSWVNTCPREMNVMKYEFTDWLQFIFLPNCVHHYGNEVITDNKNDVALQAKTFLGNDPEKEKLFQLLIELDALI